MQTICFEYTDLFGGSPNYSWVRRGSVQVPELPFFGYDGANGYVKASKRQEVYAMRLVKGEVALSGVKGTRTSHQDTVEFRPYGLGTVLFLTWE